MPVLLGEEHPPAQHGAGHSAQLVDPPQRLSRGRRPRQPQDLTVRGRYFVDVGCWPPHATENAGDGGRRPDCRALSRIGLDRLGDTFNERITGPVRPMDCDTFGMSGAGVMQAG
jgi:hypothetical protein